MRQPRISEETDTGAPKRVMFSLAVAAGIHLSIFALFQSYNPAPINIDFEVLSVELVTLAAISPPAPPEPIPEIKPVPKPTPKPALEPKRSPQPAPPPTPPPTSPPPIVIAPPTPSPAPLPEIQPPDGQSSQPVQAAPTPQGEVLIPDRWRLPVGARISLDKIGPKKGTFAHAMDCLKGFNTDCAEQRKFIFAEDQLSETDLVWMASHPHSGLSDSSLFGLSEAEIRERLGIPTAGENGFAILPGIG